MRVVYGGEEIKIMTSLIDDENNVVGKSFRSCMNDLVMDFNTIISSIGCFVGSYFDIVDSTFLDVHECILCTFKMLKSYFLKEFVDIINIEIEREKIDVKISEKYRVKMDKNLDGEALKNDYLNHARDLHDLILNKFYKDMNQLSLSLNTIIFSFDEKKPYNEMDEKEKIIINNLNSLNKAMERMNQLLKIIETYHENFLESKGIQVF